MGSGCCSCSSTKSPALNGYKGQAHDNEEKVVPNESSKTMQTSSTACSGANDRFSKCSTSQTNTAKTFQTRTMSQISGGSRHSLVGNSKSSKVLPNEKTFPKRPIGSKLSPELWARLEYIFTSMDADHSNHITKEEAKQFFKGTFGKLSADAMFNEVDTDRSGAITAAEFVDFWVHVKKSGYKEKDIMDELDALCDGGAWVDWNDGRDTAVTHEKFPSRPLICRLSKECWKKCRLLFEKVDHDGTCIITREKAEKHFTGSFSTMSVDAMFNEIDCKSHGQITGKEFMKFWVQVKSSGYSNQDIMDELDNLMEGGAWVDWKDNRTVEGAPCA